MYSGEVKGISTKTIISVAMELVAIPQNARFLYRKLYSKYAQCHELKHSQMKYVAMELNPQCKVSIGSKI